MARLPQPGGDSGNWGDILNDYLTQSHNADGTLKNASVGTGQLQDSAVVEAKLSNGVQTKLNEVAPVTSVATKTGDVTLTKSDVGLGSVDNTADADKPVSDAVQADLDAKAALVSPAFSGTPTAPTPTTDLALANKGYVDSKSVQGVNLDRTSDGPGSTDTVILSGTLDDVLVVPVPANTKMDIDFILLFTGDIADDGKIQLEGPSGATVYGWLSASGTGVTSPSGGSRNDYTITNFGATTPVMFFGVLGAATPHHVRGSITVTTGGTAGDVQFRYARNANASGAAGLGTPLRTVAGSSVRAAVVV